MPNALTRVILIALLGGVLGCHHPGPIAGGTPQPVGGTIAGIVAAAGGTTGLTGRKVTAIEIASNRRYTATTGADGGYSIKVPEGTYRLELELRAGEILQKHPDQTKISRSDIDSGRDFVVSNAR